MNNEEILEMIYNFIQARLRSLPPQREDMVQYGQLKELQAFQNFFTHLVMDNIEASRAKQEKERMDNELNGEKQFNVRLN